MSLMEMVVSVTIFAVMMLAITSIYQLVYQSQRNAIDAKNTQESIRYVMEVFSKELRSAKRDDGGCSLATLNKLYATSTNAYGEVLNFKNLQNECVSYYLAGNTLMARRDSLTASTTPNEIKVSGLKFSVKEAISMQSMVTIKADVEVLNRTSNKQKLKIQTTISSRFYD